MPWNVRVILASVRDCTEGRSRGRRRLKGSVDSMKHCLDLPDNLPCSNRIRFVQSNSLRYPQASSGKPGLPITSCPFGDRRMAPTILTTLSSIATPWALTNLVHRATKRTSIIIAQCLPQSCSSFGQQQMLFPSSTSTYHLWPP